MSDEQELLAVDSIAPYVCTLHFMKDRVFATTEGNFRLGPFFSNARIADFNVRYEDIIGMNLWATHHLREPYVAIKYRTGRRRWWNRTARHQFIIEDESKLNALETALSGVLSLNGKITRKEPLV
jgi:hypothetical protein